MNEKELYEMINAQEGYGSLAFPSLMRKVYVWMALALTITGFTAYGVSTSPAILQAIATNSVLFWGIIIGELALVLWISAGINRLSLTSATLLFVVYSVLNGVTMSFIFLVYTMTSVVDYSCNYWQNYKRRKDKKRRKHCKTSKKRK